MLSLFNIKLFQNNAAINHLLPKIGDRKWILAGFLCILLLLPDIAKAARHDTHNLRKLETYKIQLDKLSEVKEPQLDWRNPSFDIYFDTPSSDWLETIDLFIKLHAIQSPTQKAPIYITFNDDQPIALYPKGQSFEAHLKLPTRKLNSSANKIRVSYSKPDGCVQIFDGAWSIDMDDSLLIIKSMTPSRAYHISDLKNFIQSPLTQPANIAVLAKGKDKLKLEMLAAQGLALNMPDLPHFSLHPNSGKMELHLGTRQALASILRNNPLAQHKGPAIGVIRNAPLQLVITGDTTEQVMHMAQMFASYELPSSRRTIIPPGEFAWQTRFADHYKSIKGKTLLTDMDQLSFARGWGNNHETIIFDIENPLSTHGKAKLYLQPGPNVGLESEVAIDLNGSPLGVFRLNKKKNTASIKIPAGLFKGQNNQLNIKPELSPKNSVQSCISENYKPDFIIGSQSYLNITDTPTALNGDLTRFTSSGYPFSYDSGKNTAIIMATSTLRDRAAALRLMAQLAKSYGSGWVNADVKTINNISTSHKGHMLFIGTQISSMAPRDLNIVIAGRKIPPKNIQTATTTKNNDANPSVNLLSVRHNPISSGGIIALFPSFETSGPVTSGPVKGFITTTNGQSFSRTMNHMLQQNLWNRLQGSIARWNSSHVEMVQTAFTLQNSEDTTQKPKFQFNDFAVNDWTLNNLKLELDLSNFSVDISPTISRLETASRQSLQYWQSLLSNAKSLFIKTEMIPTSKASSSHRVSTHQIMAQLSQKTSTPYTPPSLYRLERNIITQKIKDGSSNLYYGTSDWLNQLIRRKQSGPFSMAQQNKPKTNILLFVSFGFLILIFLSLARPKPY